ncbi:MAG: DUF924 family protein, partial [Paracoccaceae bacterium]|nr:DUF924 family protein [Paracoccaceae bacterium]
MNANTFTPDQVLDLWFPDTGHQNSMDTHGAFWDERMQGGMDERICTQYADLTEAAAAGLLDHWAETLRGRLALLIALDQFPRSLWRDTPAAFAQDNKATRMAMDTIFREDFDELEPWEQAFFIIAISHCEGPEHLERFENAMTVVHRIAARMAGPAQQMVDGFIAQNERVLGNIRR